MTTKKATEGVKIGSARWKQLVKLGLEAVQQAGDAKWNLGDYLLEIEPLHSGTGPYTGVLERLEEYAEVVDISHSSATRYRSIAGAWPKARRNLKNSYSTHEFLSGHPERFVLIQNPLSVGRAQVLMKEYRETRTEHPQAVLTAAQRRKIAERLQEGEKPPALAREYGVSRPTIIYAANTPERGSRRPNSGPVNRRIELCLSVADHKFLVKKLGSEKLIAGYIRDLVSEDIRTEKVRLRDAG